MFELRDELKSFWEQQILNSFIFKMGFSPGILGGYL